MSRSAPHTLVECSELIPCDRKPPTRRQLSLTKYLSIQNSTLAFQPSQYRRLCRLRTLPTFPAWGVLFHMHIRPTRTLCCRRYMGIRVRTMALRLLRQMSPIFRRTTGPSRCTLADGGTTGQIPLHFMLTANHIRVTVIARSVQVVTTRPTAKARNKPYRRFITRKVQLGRLLAAHIPMARWLIQLKLLSPAMHRTIPCRTCKTTDRSMDPIDITTPSRCPMSAIRVSTVAISDQTANKVVLQ